MSCVIGVVMSVCCIVMMCGYEMVKWTLLPRFVGMRNCVKINVTVGK